MHKTGSWYKAISEREEFDPFTGETEDVPCE